MKDEIIGGLKNAIERGYTLEQAMASFVNAGYNPTQVQAAAESLSQGATTIMSSPIKASFHSSSDQSSQTPPQQIQQSSNIQQSLQTQPISQTQYPPTQQPSYFSQSSQTSSTLRSKNKVIILLIVFVFLLALFILFLIFGEKIMSLFSSSG